MADIIVNDETTIAIDPLALKPRKNPWRRKRTNFRAAGPGKPNSSNGKRFLKKLLNRKVRRLPTVNRIGEIIVPTIRKTIDDRL